MRRSLSFATALLIGLAACQTLTEVDFALAQVELNTEASEYEPGALLAMRLINGSRFDVGYNLCSTHLERRAAEGWVPEPGFGGVCSGVQLRLAPGQSDQAEWPLPAPLPAGSFRVAMTVEIEGHRLNLASSAFVVR